jgi:hypothetical protein
MFEIIDQNCKHFLGCQLAFLTIYQTKQLPKYMKVLKGCSVPGQKYHETHNMSLLSRLNGLSKKDLLVNGRPVLNS